MLTRRQAATMPGWPWPLRALAHELVDAAILGQSGVNVPARIDTDAMHMATFEADEHSPVGVADADIGGFAVVFLPAM
jgi:hypothetical protein